MTVWVLVTLILLVWLIAGLALLRLSPGGHTWRSAALVVVCAPVAILIAAAGEVIVWGWQSARRR